MKRASYREAIAWMANNDDTEWVNADPTHAISTPSVTACLTADLFGVDVERVRKDIGRKLTKVWRESK